MSTTPVSGIFTLVMKNEAGTVNSNFTTTGNYVCDIGTRIPQQNLKIENLRVQFASAADALTAMVIYLNLDFFGQQVLIDNNANIYNLPIFLDNAVVTFGYNIETEIHLTKEVPQNFTARVRLADGTVPVNIVSFAIQFSYNLAYI